MGEFDDLDFSETTLGDGGGDVMRSEMVMMRRPAPMRRFAVPKKLPGAARGGGGRIEDVRAQRYSELQTRKIE